MPDRTFTARIVEEGAGQMVLLPAEFRFDASEVLVRRGGEGLLLEPIRPKLSRKEIDALLAELDQYKHIPFMETGREQPPMPPDDDIPSLDE